MTVLTKLECGIPISLTDVEGSSDNQTKVQRVEQISQAWYVLFKSKSVKSRWTVSIQNQLWSMCVMVEAVTCGGLEERVQGFLSSG